MERLVAQGIEEWQKVLLGSKEPDLTIKSNLTKVNICVMTRICKEKWIKFSSFINTKYMTPDMSSEHTYNS